MKRSSEKGFTLVELLVVMAIIGVLIGLAVAGLNIARRGARDTTRKSDTQNIRILLEDCYLANKKYPAADGIQMVASSTNQTITVLTKVLNLEFGGDITLTQNATVCDTWQGGTVPAVTDDNIQICYQADTVGTHRPQVYELGVILESTEEVFMITENL